MQKLLQFLKKLFLNDYVFCTLFVAALMWLISIIPINKELTEPFAEALADFEVTDLGFTKLKAKEEEADTNIVIVNIGRSDNAELAALINIINDFQPAVIGINEILKKQDSFSDSLLVEALINTPEVVYAARLTNYNDSLKTWTGIEVSDSVFTVFPHGESFIRYAGVGFENMFTHERDFVTTRHFFTKATLNQQPINFFATELVEIIAPEKVDAFEKRAKEYEVINYIGNHEKFLTLDKDQVFNQEFDPASIKNKIVIMGYLGESLLDEKFWDDYKYYTPLNDKYAGKTFPDMFETVIYANITSQILNNRHIEVATPTIDMAINIVICFLNVILFSILYRAAAVWWDVFSMVITLVEIVILLLGTALVFSYYNYEINLNPSIIFILVLGNFLELYYGLVKIAIQKMSVTYMITSEVDKRRKLEKALNKAGKNALDDLRNLKI